MTGKKDCSSWRVYNKQNAVYLWSHRKICMYVSLKAQTGLSSLYGNKVLLLCTHRMHTCITTKSLCQKTVFL